MQPQFQQHEEAQSYVDPRVQNRAGVDKFMSGVMAWMAVGVAVTGAVGWGVSTSEALLAMLFGGPQYYLLMFSPLIFVWVIGSRMHKMDPPVASGLFLVFSALMGASLSLIFVIYTLGSIASIFFTTAIAFAGLALVGYTTKKDLGPMGRFLTMCFFGLFAVAIMSIFFPLSGPMYVVFNVAGLIIFAGLTAYDTQKIRQIYLQQGDGSNLAILGALTLYLDFINMFMFLLRLFGDRR